MPGNYASALFIAASKANVLDKVESEILDVIEASKQSSFFSQFIKDPSVPADTRVKAVQEISSEAKFSDVTKNFLCKFHSDILQVLCTFQPSLIIFDISA